MDNDLDRSIEELEAEVIQELEEAMGADAPKKGAAPAEKADKIDDKTSGGVEDTGPAVVSPTQKVKKPKSKEITGDPAQKGEGKPDAMDKIKEDEDVDNSVDSLEEGSCSETMSKDEMQKEMIKAMKDMPKDQMEKLYASYMKEMDMDDEEEDDEEDVAEKKAKMKEEVDARIREINVSDDVDALMNGESDLSEEFKSKAATIFESAVKSKVRGEIERMQGVYDEELVEETEKVKSELTEKIDSYLNYVVEEWMKENELAIERGLKGEIAEDFIAGLKQLFEDHYVDVPNEKYDVLEAQSEKIAELEEKVNKSLEYSVSLKEENSTLTRQIVISEATSDLTETEIEKFKSVTEDVEFDSAESFRNKIDTLKESYFPKVVSESTSTIDNVETGQAQDIDVSDSMAVYMSAISRNVKGAK
tara:strand:+ start:7555 stop:8808 length:1254 start_codon:yes stop_codon:yes gene_type:complete